MTKNIDFEMLLLGSGHHQKFPYWATNYISSKIEGPINNFLI